MVYIQGATGIWKREQLTLPGEFVMILYQLPLYVSLARRKRRDGECRRGGHSNETGIVW